ncbi:hypothetical protein NTE_03403 [Candidatus Nitrososphaera evergladensis SR1]|uniref:Uncharacterized protein n=1 Tax=Candidatus Nitrososphaera evergladensis SR1 TaxID=1459636 RepID=A0A075MUU3_9ARCH|nr:hypothetical protein [Candidatus Nitrososphaera evergladensis]AIF85431.1 hypothetical protein NTE_03403 [Candidatus Nitrososphaera evergladensis SR1]
MRVVTESTKFLTVLIPAGQTGVFQPTTPLALKSVVRIRQVGISAPTHDATTIITVRAGQHNLIDQYPDLQSFETAPHSGPESAPEIGQSDEITASVKVANAYLANTTVVIAVSYWVVLP